GCLALTQTNCAPGICDDKGTAACVATGATGESCGDTYAITDTGYVFTTADITTYADDVDAGDKTCTATDEGTSSDIVFSANLVTGETIYVTENGSMNSIVNLQVGACGDAQACVGGFDDFFGNTASYTATADET